MISFVFLAYIHMILSRHVRVTTDGTILFFYGWVVFHCCTCATFLYPSMRRWTFRLFACLGHCGQCCCGDRDAGIFLTDSCIWACARERGCWPIWQLYVSFWCPSTLFSIVAAPGAFSEALVIISGASSLQQLCAFLHLLFASASGAMTLGPALYWTIKGHTRPFYPGLPGQG